MNTDIPERETEEHLRTRLAGYSMEDLGAYRKHVAKLICHLVLMGGTALRGAGQQVFESSVEKLRCIDAEIAKRA